MDRPHAQAHPHPHPHRYPSHTKPIHYNRVPIGGPDRPPVTQSPSPGTIYASPSGDREISSYPIPSNGSPKRELGSPDIKRESGARDDSDQTADRSSVATRRSSTAYPDVSNEESKPEDAAGEPHRKKQKRNKPTLSCFECVERKTKVGLLSPGPSELDSITHECYSASPFLTYLGLLKNAILSRSVFSC